MENTHASHPLSSQETAIRKDAGLVALWALFVLLFGDPFAALFEKLQALMLAWRAGELPLPVIREPAPRQSTSRKRTPSARRTRVRTRAVRQVMIRLGCFARPQALKIPTSKAHPPRIERPPRAFFWASHESRTHALNVP